jgi:hypothetical protein
MIRQQPFHPAIQRDLGGREGIVLTVRQRALQAVHGFGALRRHRDRELRGLVLDGVEPVRIGAGVLQQPIARAQCAFERVDAALVLGIDRQHQAVRKRRRSDAGPRTTGPSPARARSPADGQQRRP